MPSGFESTSKLDPLKQPSFDTALNDFLNLSFTKYFTSLPKEELKSAQAGANLPSSPLSGASVTYDVCGAIFWVYDISLKSHRFLGTIWPLSQLQTDHTTVAALPLFSFRSIPPVVSKLPGLLWKRNRHSIPRQCYLQKPALHYDIWVELQLPCCSLYPKHRCSIPELWGHIIFPTHMQLKMTQICSNCITTFPFNKESIFYWWKWIFLSGKLDKVSLISHLFNPNRILGATT